MTEPWYTHVLLIDPISSSIRRAMYARVCGLYWGLLLYTKDQYIDQENKQKNVDMKVGYGMHLIAAARLVGIPE